jgi:hypothetical protein
MPRLAADNLIKTWFACVSGAARFLQRRVTCGQTADNLENLSIRGRFKGAIPAIDGDENHFSDLQRWSSISKVDIRSFKGIFLVFQLEARVPCAQTRVDQSSDSHLLSKP